MRNDKRLPDAELEVMQTIWSLGTQVTAAEVQQHADKDWKMTSVLTFLSRLCDKGFLSCTKEGRQNLYTPLVSEKDYRQRERRLSAPAVRRLGEESGREPVGCGRADRAGHRRAARVPRQADALRRGSYAAILGKTAQQPDADRPDRIAGGARAAHSAAADEKALSGPYGMCGVWCGCSCS